MDGREIGPNARANGWRPRSYGELRRNQLGNFTHRRGYRRYDEQEHDREHTRNKYNRETEKK
ncbi:MAG: hypothetical protein ABSF56_00940 [Minisyncoccia bacterium]